MNQFVDAENILRDFLGGNYVLIESDLKFYACVKISLLSGAEVLLLIINIFEFGPFF